MRNSLNEDSEKQDRSQKTTMDDSAEMTIEFLRARLQSERSVSKTARERAEELAKRVVELEEQLKIVTLQRKKAEKAAAEVLAILENNGISDFSEVNDSSSDLEGINCESKEDNNSIKEEKSHFTLIPRRKEARELSGWDGEASPSTRRSLSWKSCTGSVDSLEKKKHINQARRRSRSMSIGGISTKQLLGKSCRQIKRKETRSALAEIRDDSLLQENGTVTEFGDTSNEKDRTEMLKEGSQGKVFLEGSVSDNKRDVDMESALEDQALLIGRYEAEENAQREWEEKFKENNSCTPDSCEPGNRSDITEEGEIRKGTVETAHAILSHCGVNSNLEDVKTLANGFTPTSTLDMGCSQDQQSNSSIGNEFSFPNQEYPEAKVNGKQELDWQENNSSHPTSCGSSEHQVAQTFPIVHAHQSFYKGGSTGSQNEVSTHHEASNGLGDVLESLQLAKLSLKHEISRLPLASQRKPMTRTETPVQANKARDGMEIPVGYAGLFRVPTSLQSETTSPPNAFSPYSDSGSSSTRQCYPDLGVGVARSLYSASSNLEMGSRVSPSRPYLDDPYLDFGIGLPASTNRYTIYPSYADVMLRMPTNDGYQSPYSSMGSPGLPADDRYSGYSDQIRPNMHC